MSFEPGESPFRAKGHVYKALLASADARVPGGTAAVLARLDPKLRAFFDVQFLAASTYDIFPLIPFGQAGAKLTGLHYSEFVRGAAAFSAKRDMRGIHRVLLKLSSPRAVVQRLPRILIQYLDFGKFEGHFEDERTYHAIATGIPRPVDVWLINVARGFVPVVMEAAGAYDVDVRIDAPEVEREQRGITLVRNAFVMTWKE